MPQSHPLVFGGELTPPRDNTCREVAQTRPGSQTEPMTT